MIRKNLLISSQRHPRARAATTLWFSATMFITPCHEVCAQNMSGGFLFGGPPPPASSQDANEVSIYGSEYNYNYNPSEPPLQIGSSENGLSVIRKWGSNGWNYDFHMYVFADYYGALVVTANMLTGIKYFIIDVQSSGSGSIPNVIYRALDGSQMTDVAGGWQVTEKNGDRYIFTARISLGGFLTMEDRGYISKIIKANGEVIDYYYQNVTDTTTNPPWTFSRLSSIVSSLGYQAKIIYTDTNYNNTRTDYARLWRWSNISSIKMLNMAYERCPLVENVCAPAKQWPTMTRSLTWTGRLDDGVMPKFWTETVNRPDRPQTVYSFTSDNNGSYVTNFVQNTSPASVRTPTYSGKHVILFNNNGHIWKYYYSNDTAPTSDIPTSAYTFPIPNMSFAARKTVRTNPLGDSDVFYGDETGRSFLEIDANGNKRSFLYDVGTYYSNYLAWTSVKNPEGDGYTRALDSRSNFLSLTRTRKPGTNETDMTESAVYSATCANILVCNQPSLLTDPNGNRTDFTYDPLHGGVLTETRSPDQGGIRAQTRYGYAQRYAWILSDSGGYQKASSPVWVLTSTSSCRASVATGNPAAPCAANDEIRTDYDYGPDAGPTNLLLRGVTVTSGGQAQRTCFAYDRYGRKIAETKPRAGLSACS